MDFVTITALAEAIGKSRRTVDRSLKAFEKVDTEKFNSLIKHPERKGLEILYSPDLIAFLGISTKKVTVIQAEISTPTKKEKEPKVRPSRVISVDQVPDGIEKDFADFNLIMEDFKTGEWTLPDCIERHSIPQSKFFYWINTRPEFNQLYTEVYELHRRSFNILLRELGKKSLMKMVTGYDKNVESVTYKEMISPTGQAIRVPLERKVYQKHIVPNVTAVTFSLTNRDPDDYKRFWNPNDANKGRVIDPLDQMTNDELFEIVSEARKSGLLTTGDVGSQKQM